MKVGLILGILAYNVWWAVLIIIAILIPFSKLSIISGRVNYEANRQVTKQQRKYLYFGKVLSSRDYVEERVLFQYGNRINEMWLDNYEIARKYQLKVEKKWFIRMKSSGFMTAGFCIIILFLLLAPTLNGVISIGQFAAVFSSIGLAFSVMQGVVDRNLGLVSRNIGFTKNYVNFMDLPELSPEFNFCESDNDDIILKDVSFQYPNANSFALKDITLTIKKNETVAVVGENGSGKTTLAKVLTGIYEPSTGSVSVMGCDISEKLPYSRISAVNQKFNRYALTLKENITISDQKGDESAIPEIIEKINLELDPQIFPDALETPLTTEFGGVDLSGGQWQKVAICRGIYRNHDVIVLDEPTAAIDPIEESSVYRSFTEMSKDKTAIIITHRIGSAKIADRILVMDQGRIMETGTHDELIKKGGKYAEMYNLQADWYLIEGSNT